MVAIHVQVNCCFVVFLLHNSGWEKQATLKQWYQIALVPIPRYKSNSKIKNNQPEATPAFCVMHLT